MSKDLSKDYKMMICVRTDLGMGKGKMVSHGCHGAVGLACLPRSKEQNAVWREWKRLGDAKIAVGVSGLEKLREIEEKCVKAGVPYYVVEDEGITQIPSGSLTVIAIGPASAEELDEITGKLKLL